VAPIYFSEHGNGGHEWLVEFEVAPASLDEFTSELDRVLQTLNSDYEAKRYRDIALRPPLLHAASEGLFSDWLKSKGKLGGQHKVPRLSNDRKYMDELLPLSQRPGQE